MNRPIKFRAWDKKQKKWLLGYDVGTLGGFGIFGECMLFGEWSKIVNDDMQGLVDVALMQFTGLHDKNGKEIYEGDIVEWSTGKGTKDRMEVKFYERHQGFMPYVNYSTEVIGNIYENPELLKV